MKKPSFFDRLSKSVSLEKYEDDFDAFDEIEESDEGAPRIQEDGTGVWQEEEEVQEEGELPIDMYQTDEDIIIRALVAGVSPDDLDIAITRDMVTIRGQRDEGAMIAEDDYFHHELYWGGFSRTILLPEEVLIDEAEAKERHGLLEIVLPKVDKERSTQLKVKTK